MKYMTGNEIRKAYLDFFESKKTFKITQFFPRAGERPELTSYRRRYGPAQTLLYRQVGTSFLSRDNQPEVYSYG